MSRRFQFSLKTLLLLMLGIALLAAAEGSVPSGPLSLAAYLALVFLAWTAMGAAIGLACGKVIWFAGVGATAGLLYPVAKGFWFLEQMTPFGPGVFD